MENTNKTLGQLSAKELKELKADELQQKFIEELGKINMKSAAERQEFFKYIIGFRTNQYTLRNRLLIRAQAEEKGINPYATTTMKEWNKQKTSIKAGEHPMSIMMPATYFIYLKQNAEGKWETLETTYDKNEISKREKDVSAGKLEKKAIKYFFFKPCIFSIEQTNMKEEDKIAYLQRYNAHNTSEENTEILKKEKALVEALGIKIVEEENKSRLGFYAPVYDVMGLLKGMPIDAQLSTITHELGHYLFHRSEETNIFLANSEEKKKNPFLLNRYNKEIQAQLFSHMVLEGLGIDSEKENSLKYIDGYLYRDEDSLDSCEKSILFSHLNIVVDAAQKLVKILEKDSFDEKDIKELKDFEPDRFFYDKSKNLACVVPKNEVKAFIEKREKETKLRKEAYGRKLKEELNKAPQNIPNDSGIVVYDIETTGLNPDEDEILQFTAIDGDGNILLDTYFEPLVKEEWPEAEKINKISADMIKGFPHISEKIAEIRDVLASGKTHVSYNGKFDRSFLEKLGINFRSSDEKDVMLDFAPIYGEKNDKYIGGYKYKNLKTCSEYFNYQNTGAFHDSLEDVRATLFCYKEIEKDKANNYFTVSNVGQLFNSENRTIHIENDKIVIDGNVKWSLNNFWKDTDIKTPDNKTIPLKLQVNGSIIIDEPNSFESLEVKGDLKVRRSSSIFVKDNIKADSIDGKNSSIMCDKIQANNIKLKIAQTVSLYDRTKNMQFTLSQNDTELLKNNYPTSWTNAEKDIEHYINAKNLDIDYIGVGEGNCLKRFEFQEIKPDEELYQEEQKRIAQIHDVVTDDVSYIYYEHEKNEWYDDEDTYLGKNQNEVIKNFVEDTYFERIGAGYCFLPECRNIDIDTIDSYNLYDIHSDKVKSQTVFCSGMKAQEAEIKDILCCNLNAVKSVVNEINGKNTNHFPTVDVNNLVCGQLITPVLFSDHVVLGCKTEKGKDLSCVDKAIVSDDIQVNGDYSTLGWRNYNGEQTEQKTYTGHLFYCSQNVDLEELIIKEGIVHEDASIEKLKVDNYLLVAKTANIGNLKASPFAKKNTKMKNDSVTIIRNEDVELDELDKTISRSR